MSQNAKKTCDEMLVEIDRIERQKGWKSDEYIRAVREFGKIVHQAVSHVPVPAFGSVPVAQMDRALVS